MPARRRCVVPRGGWAQCPCRVRPDGGVLTVTGPCLLQLNGVKLAAGELYTVPDGSEFVVGDAQFLALLRVVVRRVPLTLWLSRELSAPKTDEVKQELHDIRAAACRLGAHLLTGSSVAEGQATHYLVRSPTSATHKLIKAVVHGLQLVTHHWLLQAAEAAGELPSPSQFRPKVESKKKKEPVRKWGRPRLGVLLRRVTAVFLTRADDAIDLMTDAGAQIIRAYEMEDEDFDAADLMALMGEGRTSLVAVEADKKQETDSTMARMAKLKAKGVKVTTVGKVRRRRWSVLSHGQEAGQAEGRSACGWVGGRVG